MGSRAVERIGAVENLRRTDARGRGPDGAPGAPDEPGDQQLLQATAHEKGAEVIRCSTRCWDRRFRRGMDLY
jgi:hypothetical protein